MLKGYETAVNYVAFSTDSSRIGGGAHVKTKHLGRVTESTARLSVAIGVDSWFCGPPKTSPTETRVCTRSARKGIQLPAIFELGKGANQGAAAGIRLSKTFDLRPTPEETFLTGRRAGGDSAKTYEFSAFRTGAEIRMNFRDEPALNGRLRVFPEKR